MKHELIKAFIAEKNNVVIIHFEKFVRINLPDFIASNPELALEKKKIIFSPQKPKKSREVTIKVPILSRFEMLKKTLEREGLI